MKITVFTPTYNRKYIIEQLYHSLQRQTFSDFEWVVVDDGSTDGTDELFAKIACESNPFPIRYLKTENGGKHRAINIGVQKAQGDLFFIVDSDDYLTDNALQEIIAMESTIPEQEKHHFAGVCGQKGHSEDAAMGNTFQGEVLDATALDRVKYHIQGDKAEVFYTSILKKYPFPTFDGEKFITECVVWDKIAADGYLLRFFNSILMICNYLPDGLTAQGDARIAKNPKGFGLYYHQCDKFGKMCGLEKWNTYLQYYYYLRENVGLFEIAHNLHMNVIKLWLRLSGMKIFYKLYSK